MSFAEFKSQVSQQVDAAAYPIAAEVAQNTLIYQRDHLLSAPRTDALSEIDRALSEGPGVVVIRQGSPDHAVIDEASALFDRIIAEEKENARGDHFAKPGANDRIWNSLQKHALAAPANYCAYYGQPAIDLVCRAWLGDGYQMTAQVNRVNPGGAAQTPHRDYHLGFMSNERMRSFPAAVHRLSPRLTLQGAIAHCDMTPEMGPTVFLPFSQQYEAGYTEFHREEFQTYFAEHHSQLTLMKGDLMFFNPALMHGAGTNQSSDKFRLGNLVQVSSAFGRAMESVDRVAVCKAIYSHLSGLPEGARTATLAASAEGYAFPTNLDSDPPIGGMAPQTQAELMRQALSETWSFEQVCAALDAQTKRREA